MSDVTRILSAIEQGDSQAAEQLLPLVYEELRKLAAQRLSKEKAKRGQRATARIHWCLVLVAITKTVAWTHDAEQPPPPGPDRPRPDRRRPGQP